MMDAPSHVVEVSGPGNVLCHEKISGPSGVLAASLMYSRTLRSTPSGRKVAYPSASSGHGPVAATRNSGSGASCEPASPAVLPSVDGGVVVPPSIGAVVHGGCAHPGCVPA